MTVYRETVICGSILAGFRDVLAARGIDLDDLLSESGIASDDLKDLPESELPVEAVIQLMERAAERANDAGLGLALAEACPPGAAGLLGYLVVHARTVRDALQSFARYAGLLLHPSPVMLREGEDAATLSWSVPTWQNTRRVQFASFINALMVLRLRHVAGRNWFPLAVEVEHPQLPCGPRLNRIFGPRVTFNARENSILVDPDTLQRVTSGADPRLYKILRETGESKLKALASRPDLVARTARAITQTLNTDRPLLELVAERMRMTPRALQNRLAQHGTSFERILSDTRRNLAERYLRDTDLPLTEIGFLLGFSEQSAFTRAARAWFGRPPRQLRKEVGWMMRSRATQKAIQGSTTSDREIVRS